MHKLLAITTALTLAASCGAAWAETAQERTLKAPEKSMGDQGKLPATENMSGAVPDMTGPRTAATPSDNEGGTVLAPKGPPKRMGSDGKLPATDNMSGAVPPMTRTRRLTATAPQAKTRIARRPRRAMPRFGCFRNGMRPSRRCCFPGR